MAAPNIVNVTSIYGKTAVQIITTTATSVVSNTASSGKVLKVNALYVGNIHATLSANLNVDVFRGSTAYRLIFGVEILKGTSIDVLSKPIYLEEGDSIRLTASANSSLEAVCSYEEIS